MRHTVLAALLAAAAPAALSAAPVPKEQLLVPPANAVHYVVVSEAGKHGDMWRWTLPDGRIAYRHSQSLRGWITETTDNQNARDGCPKPPLCVGSRQRAPSSNSRWGPAGDMEEHRRFGSSDSRTAILAAGGVRL